MTSLRNRLSVGAAEMMTLCITEASPGKGSDCPGIGNSHLHADTKDLEALDGIRQHPCHEQDDISHHQGCHQPQQLQVFDNLQNS